MSTQAQTIAVNNPIRWFMVGVATTLVAVAMVAGLALAIVLPATQSGALGNGTAPASAFDEGFRLQRAGEIGAGNGSVPAPAGVADHRKGEITAGQGSASGGSTLGLTDHRRGEINSGN